MDAPGSDFERTWRAAVKRLKEHDGGSIEESEEDYTRIRTRFGALSAMVSKAAELAQKLKKSRRGRVWWFVPLVFGILAIVGVVYVVNSVIAAIGDGGKDESLKLRTDVISKSTGTGLDHTKQLTQDSSDLDWKVTCIANK